MRVFAVKHESEDTDRQLQPDLGESGGQRTGRSHGRCWWRQGLSPEEEERTIRSGRKTKKEGRTHPDDDHDGNEPAHAQALKGIRCGKLRDEIWKGELKRVRGEAECGGE